MRLSQAPDDWSIAVDNWVHSLLSEHQRSSAMSRLLEFFNKFARSVEELREAASHLPPEPGGNLDNRSTGGDLG